MPIGEVKPEALAALGDVARQNYEETEARYEQRRKSERERIEQKNAEEKAARARRWKRIKAEARQEFLDSGGEEEGFEDEWPALRRALIAQNVMADKETERERATVKTWR